MPSYLSTVQYRLSPKDIATHVHIHCRDLVAQSELGPQAVAAGDVR